jgi:hypothetical protein
LVEPRRSSLCFQAEEDAARKAAAAALRASSRVPPPVAKHRPPAAAPGRAKAAEPVATPAASVPIPTPAAAPAPAKAAPRLRSIFPVASETPVPPDSPSAPPMDYAFEPVASAESAAVSADGKVASFKRTRGSVLFEARRRTRASMHGRVDARTLARGHTLHAYEPSWHALHCAQAAPPMRPGESEAFFVRVRHTDAQIVVGPCLIECASMRAGFRRCARTSGRARGDLSPASRNDYSSRLLGVPSRGKAMLRCAGCCTSADLRRFSSVLGLGIVGGWALCHHGEKATFKPPASFHGFLCTRRAIA